MMCRIIIVTIYFLLGVHLIAIGQQLTSGCIYDSRSKEAIPFATIKFGDSGQGMVAGLDGKFVLPSELAMPGMSYVEISSLGYQSKKVSLPLQNFNVYLLPDTNSLREVVIKPSRDKVRRIIKAAIARKQANNPDNYDWYSCHVYYKMLADITVPDSLLDDTGKESRQIKEFLRSQHLLLSETYSIRTWGRPQKLQEDVFSTRFSGFKKSMFASLVTDVVPFHCYSDYLTLNGKDYHNPISRGFEQYYSFSLNDELIQGSDTVWMLGFRPRGHNANDLTGTVFINSNGFAISHIIAKANDTMLKMNVRIEQEYMQVPGPDSESRWFPRNLNYIIDWDQQSKKSASTIHMKGTSFIDSISWLEAKDFHFDKAHTIRLRTNADTQLNMVRPMSLDAKEQRTYKVIDSLGAKFHSDEIMSYISKLPEGKIPTGIFDFNLNRLFAYNYYENLRLGIGAQTNEKLVRWLSVGGWAGYGFNDKEWKYGAFAEVYADKYKEFVFKAGYSKDINDPGRVSLSPDLDKNYLNSYLLRRVDEVQTYYATVKKKVGYWNAMLEARQQVIIPQYKYSLLSDGSGHNQFNTREASLGLRYAFAERTAPLFGTYISLGSKYPIWYARVTAGILQSGNMNTNYTQALTAIAWQKHINRIGNEHLLLEAGKSWSNEPLPLSKLFAGNGAKYDVNGNVQVSI
jgi:hypothetical protein